MIFQIAGVRLWPVALVQVALSTIDVWVIASLARRIFSERTGLVAGLLAALYGPFVFAVGFLLKETLGLLLLDLFLWSAIDVVARGRWSLAWLPGVLFGLSCLVRPNFLPLALGVLAWWCFAWPEPFWLKRTIAAALFTVGTVAAILPVSVRNYRVGGEWVWISAHGGHNFYIGNRPAANGLYEPLVMGGG